MPSRSNRPDASSDASAPESALPTRTASERVPFSKMLRERVTRSAAHLNPIPYVRPRTQKVGQMPGEVTFVGKAPSEPPHLSVIDYDAHDLAAYEPADARALHPLRDSPTTTWINLEGLHDTDLIKDIGEHFGLHPLVLEDIANTGQRPKVEAFNGSDEHARYLFVIVKMLTYSEEHQALHSEQVSLTAGPGWLISFQERSGDVFDPVRHRLREGRGRMREGGSDYLAYALLDVIVDHYFLVLEAFGAQTEDLEEDITTGHPDPEVRQRLGDLRRDLILMRRAIWPTRDLFATLERDRATGDGPSKEARLLSEEVRPFVRDTYDHVMQVINILESLREVTSGLDDLYMSALSHRMNEVMQGLTIIGTIFIPLTFVAGLYGMNFEYMPELQWRYAYFVVLGGMGGVGLALVYYFRRIGWL